MSGVDKERNLLLDAGSGQHGEESELAQNGRSDAKLIGDHEQGAKHERHEDSEALAVEELADASSGSAERECSEKNGDKDDMDPRDVAEEVGEFDEGFKVVLVHEAYVSLFLTLWLLGMFLLCVLQGGFSSWWQLAVLVGGYSSMFVCTYLDTRPNGRSLSIVPRTMFMESRAAVGMVGLGAVLFGSPVLLKSRRT